MQDVQVCSNFECLMLVGCYIGHSILKKPRRLDYANVSASVLEVPVHASGFIGQPAWEKDGRLIPLSQVPAESAFDYPQLGKFEEMNPGWSLTAGLDTLSLGTSGFSASHLWLKRPHPTSTALCGHQEGHWRASCQWLKSPVKGIGFVSGGRGCHGARLAVCWTGAACTFSHGFSDETAMGSMGSSESSQ